MAAKNDITHAASAVFRHWYSLNGELASPGGTRGLPLVARLAPEKPRAASAQADYWNRAGARRWIDNQDILDQPLRPVSARLMAAALAEAGECVIDVGCGCGATTIDFGARVAPGGEVLGLDISAPMLERARERAPAGLPLCFALGDAASHELMPCWADLVVSRFGVMFFADPARAFANLRQGLRPGGRLAFACWHTAKLNPWMTMPSLEASKHVPPLPEVGPEDPGPFSFADEKRVRRILHEAGYDDIELKPNEFDLDIALGRGLDTAV